MISQSDYNQSIKLLFIIASFVILFVASAYASVTTDHAWSSTKILGEINNHRKIQKLSQLQINNELSKLAMMRLTDMEKNDYFAHESPTDNDIDSILTLASYKYDERGENLAYGEFINEADVMNGWMNSKWHKYNIEYSSFNNIGIAHKVVRDYMGGNYILIVTVFTKEEKAVVKKETQSESKSKNPQAKRSVLSKLLTSLRHSILEPLSFTISS